MAFETAARRRWTLRNEKENTRDNTDKPNDSVSFITQKSNYTTYNRNWEKRRFLISRIDRCELIQHETNKQTNKQQKQDETK